MATNRTVRYIRFNSNNASVHNSNSGINRDGDGPSSFQKPTFIPYDRITLGTGTAWDIASQKVTLTNSNPDSQTFRVRFTNDTALALGAPHYGAGSTATSMLIPHKGIPASRVAAYAQTIPYYVRTFFENESGSFTFNVEIKLAPGKWNGSPTNINPVTFNRNTINSSGNVFRGEKFVPDGRGTLYHSGTDFDADGHLSPFGVSNIGTFNHYGGEDGFGFSDFIPTYDNGNNGLGDGTAWAEIKITTSGSGSYGVTFYADPILEYDHLQPTQSTVLFYQARDIIMDGSDSDHTIPTMATTSTMDVVANQEFFLDPLTLATTSSVSEDSVNKKICPQTELATTSSLSVTPSFKLGFTKTLDATSLFLVTTANFTLLDNETLTASTSLSATPSFKLGSLLTLTASTSTATAAGIKFDVTGDYIWDTFNLNTYFEIGYSADNFALEEGEYTWDFLATTAWDDWPVTTWLGNEQNWDNWPKDVWETPYVKNASASMLISPSFKLGDVVTYTGAFTLAEDVALNQPAQATITTTTSVEATAQGLLKASAALTSGFSPTLSVGLKYALDDTPISITGAFNAVLTASAITDTFADIDVTTSISITPTFKPAGESIMAVSSTTTLTPTFKPAGLAALVGFVSTLQTARVFYQADPYFTIKVATETRQLVLPFENRQTLVKQENRLNTITAENRDYLVSQETRNLKLRTPPFRNRFSTPRVRQEQ